MLHSLRAQKRAREILITKILAIFSAILLFILFVGFFSRSSFIRTDVEIIGNLVTDKNIVQAKINEILSRNLLFVIHRDNFIFFPWKKIKIELTEEFPRIKEINIEPINLRKIEISISEREGNFLACKTESECFFVDDAGFVYAPSPYLFGNIFFRFFSSSFELGQFLLSSEEFNEIVSFKEKLDFLELETNWIVINEENFELYFPNQAKIIVNRNDDFKLIINNLESALASEPLKTKLKDEFEKLEYLDLRFDNRVVYKFKE